MAITYSTRLQPVKNHEEEKRVYASTQSNHMMDLDEVSEHISEHNSVYSPDVVAGVTKKLVSCMKELLLMGNRIQLGDLGVFCLQIENVGWQELPSELAKYDPSIHVRRVNVRWQPSEKLQGLIDRSTFEYDVPRSVQAEVRRAYKAGQDVTGLLQTLAPDADAPGTGADGEDTEAGSGGSDAGSGGTPDDGGEMGE